MLIVNKNKYDMIPKKKGIFYFEIYICDTFPKFDRTILS